MSHTGRGEDKIVRHREKKRQGERERCTDTQEEIEGETIKEREKQPHMET